MRCGSCDQVFDGNAALFEPLAPSSAPTIPLPAEIDEFDLAFDGLDDGVRSPLPVIEPEPSAQDLLGGDTLSDQELQAAIDAELAALDDRMAAAQPAPALPPAQKPAAPAPPATPAGDERREPTFDIPPQPDQIDEEDEQALLQLAAGAAKPYDDIPPSHTLLRTASAPPAGYYDEPQLHSSESLFAAPAADRHTFEPAAAAPAQVAKAKKIDAPDDEPGFVKRERHRERYGRATTIALCLGIVLCLGALAAQGLTTFRNPLAAAMPSLKPALVAACNALGCKVELPSQIDELAIEQGELQALNENTFSFATALKNSSGSAQAWPHIELVLDDANDKTVLRRVFAPRDYLDPEVDIAQGVPARSEQPVKLYFELKQPKVSGYHIAVFYP